jgi:CRISPR-associated protein Cmr6
MIGELPPVPGRSDVAALFGARAIPQGGNAGLVFDRYLRIWAPLERLLHGPPSREAMKSGSLTEDLRRFVSDYEALRTFGEPMVRDAHQRLEGIAPSAAIAVRFEARFVSGLGAAHPLENGFTFDRTVGAPVIAGSSVKGLCRAQAKLEGLEKGAIRQLFGPDVEENRHAAGDLVFLPALPSTWPRLEVDLVNCHHPRYMDGLLDAPVDVESPVPVPFLTVAAGTVFVFRLFSRSQEEKAEEEEKAEKEGRRLLLRGLEDLGIGAKTAVGYGTGSPISAG